MDILGSVIEFARIVSVSTTLEVEYWVTDHRDSNRVIQSALRYMVWIHAGIHLRGCTCTMVLHNIIKINIKCKNQPVDILVMNQLINPSPIIHEKKTSTRVRHSCHCHF